jgi:hypothetical protein
MLRSYEYVNLADIITSAPLDASAAGIFTICRFCAHEPTVANDRAILGRYDPGFKPGL